MYADDLSLHRFEGFGGEDHAGDTERVDMVAGRERVGEIFEFVAFVVIFDSGAEVDCIGSVGEEGVGEIDGDASSLGGDARHGVARG